MKTDPKPVKKIFTNEKSREGDADQKTSSRNIQLYSNSVISTYAKVSEPKLKQDILKNCFESEHDIIRGDSIMGNSVEEFLIG